MAERFGRLCSNGASSGFFGRELAGGFEGGHQAPRQRSPVRLAVTLGRLARALCDTQLGHVSCDRAAIGVLWSDLLGFTRERRCEHQRQPGEGSCSMHGKTAR
jgi:hypothetical protein